MMTCVLQSPLFILMPTSESVGGGVTNQWYGGVALRLFARPPWEIESAARLPKSDGEEPALRQTTITRIRAKWILSG